MQRTTCEACGQAAPAYDIVSYGSTEGGYRTLCGRCFNTEVAQRSGLMDFEHVRFEPVEMNDASGRSHEFHFRAHLFGSGIALDAFELRDDAPSGYQFQVVGEPEEDLFALLARLIAKMRRALAFKHVEESELGLQVTDHLLVRGKIGCDPDDDDRMPVVVIDGRELSWEEFGRMVATFEGWQFKMEFGDMSEEL